MQWLNTSLSQGAVNLLHVRSASAKCVCGGLGRGGRGTSDGVLVPYLWCIQFKYLLFLPSSLDLLLDLTNSVPFGKLDKEEIETWELVITNRKRLYDEIKD